jgi:SPASM domain peptide maturase of grasp-with-spasm system
MKNLTLDIPFKLFTDCILVKGYSRSTIVDLSRGNYFLIPNDLYNILKKYDGKSINDVIFIYGKENTVTLKEYFSFLVKNELIFFNRNKENFPKLDFSSFDIPSDIYQTIIDFNDNFEHINESVVNSLTTLNCKYIQLRFYKNYDIETLERILELFRGSRIVGVDLFLDYKYLTPTIFKKIEVYTIVNNVYVFNSPEERTIYQSISTKPFNVIEVVEKISDCRNCGIVSKNYFTVNISSFSNSVKSNSCLNKKLSIDSDGNLKNCPSMGKVFGNIKKVNIEKVAKSANFKKVWDIKKEDIKVCKDCEFRHICTDCRAYTVDPRDIYSKPLKCGYNPYNNEWEDWKNIKSNYNAISYYKMQELFNIPLE